MRANTRHQIRETKWILWFLFVSWWWLPLKLVIWFFVQVFKALIWVIEEVNGIGTHRGRSF